MNKSGLISIALFVELIAGFKANAAETNPDELKTLARAQLIEAVKQVVADKAIARYFVDLDPSNIEISERKEMPDALGWILRWRYLKDVKPVVNPNKESAAVVIPGVVTNDGISIELFIAFDRGGARVSSNKLIEISENPRLVFGYYLLT